MAYINRPIFLTFSEFEQKFLTEDIAINYFIKARYKGVLCCPYCHSAQKIYRYRKRIKVWCCKKCNNSFSPLTGTIFEKSSTDMRKWLYTIYMVINTEISGVDLKKKISVTYKTAWRMLKLVREEMENEETKKAFRYFLGRGIQDEFEVVPRDKTVRRSLLKKSEINNYSK